MAEDPQRNFRSAYYEKVGFRGVEENKSLEILLKDNPLGMYITVLLLLQQVHHCYYHCCSASTSKSVHMRFLCSFVRRGEAEHFQSEIPSALNVQDPCMESAVG